MLSWLWSTRERQLQARLEEVLAVNKRHVDEIERLQRLISDQEEIKMAERRLRDRMGDLVQRYDKAVDELNNMRKINADLRFQQRTSSEKTLDFSQSVIEKIKKKPGPKKKVKVASKDN